MSRGEAIEIAEGVFRLGPPRTEPGSIVNTYLLLGGEEGVLIDPGSAAAFEEVYGQLSPLLPAERLAYIVLLHHGPDAASNTALFEERGFAGRIALHSHASPYAESYGLSSPFHLLDEEELSLGFGENRRLSFIPAPYLPYPDAVTAYDEQTGILFSGELFGSATEEASLFADENEEEDRYLEEMKEYQRRMMPGNEVLRPVLDILLQRHIRMICPHHGSILRRGAKDYIKTFREVESGRLLNPVRRTLITEGGYSYLINRILQRLLSGFGSDELVACFQDSPFDPDPQTGELVSLGERADELWNSFFDTIYAYGGTRWLTFIEPLLQRFERDFGVTRPGIYLGELAREKRRSLGLREEKENLKKINENLRSNLELTQDEMTKDPVTGLYNEDFLVRYLLNIFNEQRWDDFTALFIRIDRMKQINDSFGDYEGNEVIRGVGNLIFTNKEENDYLFRSSGPVFVLITPDTDSGLIDERAELLRNTVERDRGFLERVTVSVAVIPMRYADLSPKSAVEVLNFFFTRGNAVLRDTLRGGENQVLHDTGEEKRSGMEGRVLIAEFDHFHAELIRDALERLSINVRICMNGPEVVSEVEEFHPDVIVSELFLPEMDAFTIKEELEENTKTKDIPFLLISHQKNESSVVRAIDLGIMHYFKKPYMLSELMGIINTYVERALQYGT